MRIPSLLLALMAPFAASAQSTTLSGTVQAASDAANLGVNWVVPDAVAFTNNNGCIACHRQGATVYGASISQHNGFKLQGANAPLNDFLAKAIADDQRASNGGWYYPHAWDGGFPLSKSGYALYGLAGYTAYSGSTVYLPNLVNGVRWAAQVASSLSEPADGLPLSGATSHYIAQDHGSVPTTWDWTIPTAQTAVAAQVAIEFSPRGSLSDVDAFLQSLADTLEGQYVRSNGGWANQDVVYANIGVIAAGRTPAANADTAAMRDDLIARAYPSGGWGYWPQSGPDPLNTGEALYALCLDGVRLDNPTVSAGVNWLTSVQAADGHWDEPGHAADLPTIYATLALGCYGTKNIAVTQTSTGGAAQAGSPTSQQLSFGVGISNTGYVPNTYSVSGSGGLPGSTVSVSPGTLTLDPQQAGSVNVTVTLPPGIPSSTTIPVSVSASFDNGNGISTETTTYIAQAGPPPSSNALPTQTRWPGGDLTAYSGQTIALVAAVADGAGNAITSGSMTFYNGKVALGTVLAGADGNYRLDYHIPNTVNVSQALTASYAGYGTGGAGNDYAASSATAALNLPPRPINPPAPAIAIHLDPSGAADGDTIDFDISACPPETEIDVWDGDPTAAPIAKIVSTGAASYSLSLPYGPHSLTFATVAPGASVQSLQTSPVSVSLYPLPVALTALPPALSSLPAIEGQAQPDSLVIAQDEQDEDVPPQPEIVPVDASGHFRHLLLHKTCHKRPSCHVHKIHYHHRKKGVGDQYYEARATADTQAFSVWDDAPGTIIVTPGNGSTVDTNTPAQQVVIAADARATAELPAAVRALGPIFQLHEQQDDSALFDGVPSAQPASLDLTRKLPGAHTLTAQAQDNLGNSDPQPVQSTFAYSPSIPTIKNVTGALLFPIVAANGEQCDFTSTVYKTAGPGNAYGDTCLTGKHVGDPHCQKLNCVQVRELGKQLDNARADELAGNKAAMVNDLNTYNAHVTIHANAGRIPQDLATVLKADASWKAAH